MGLPVLFGPTFPGERGSSPAHFQAATKASDFRSRFKRHFLLSGFHPFGLLLIFSKAIERGN